MRLFFASDIHGSLPATQEVLEKYNQSGAEHLIILGDILNHGPRNPVPEGYQPAAVAELLNDYCDQIIAVRGNCDSEVDQMLLNFAMSESYSWVLLENGKRLFLTHGHLFNTDNRPHLKAGDVLVHGHTHIPVAEKDNGIVVYNPGSITFPKGGYVPTYGLYENNELKVLSFSGDVLKQVCL